MEIERLKDFRKSFSLNQTEFCKPLGLLQGSYSDIERGKSSITFKMVKELIKVYDLNPLWLFTGKGGMCLSQFSTVAMEEQPSYGKDNSKVELSLLHEQINSLKGENEALKKLVKLYENKS